jgi:hypothetical protein
MRVGSKQYAVGNLQRQRINKTKRLLCAFFCLLHTANCLSGLFAVKAQIILCASKYSLPGITPPYKALRTVPERITALSFPELSIPVILKIGGC